MPRVMLEYSQFLRSMDILDGHNLPRVLTGANSRNSNLSASCGGRHDVGGGGEV